MFFGHEAVETTAHPKVLRTPADPVDEGVAERIEAVVRSAMASPEDVSGLRRQLRELVPDFHVPAPPPPVEGARRDSPAPRLKAL